MANWSFYDQVAGSISFNLKGYTGRVSVYYGVNADPVKAGFDSLPGLNFDLQACCGYPLMHARIDEYEGMGYRTTCGWIQIVTNTIFDARDRQTAAKEMVVSIDLAPSFQDTDIPFASYGNFPQLFDAPCHNLGSHAELNWIADTFLTSIPARSREEEIAWLLGFRWGYTENDRPNDPPRLLPFEVTRPQIWNQYLPYLRAQYPGWKFRNA